MPSVSQRRLGPPPLRFDALVALRQRRLACRAFCPLPVSPEMGAGAARRLNGEQKRLLGLQDLVGYQLRHRVLGLMNWELRLVREDVVRGGASLPPNPCHC